MLKVLFFEWGLIYSFSVLDTKPFNLTLCCFLIDIWAGMFLKKLFILNLFKTKKHL